MKRILFLLLTVVSLSAHSQAYNNEWIDYSKTYYKFKIRVTGLYRISLPVLSNIGLGSSNADDFQLWRNGKQIPLYTSTQHAPLATGGYIEFWADANDGKPDLPMYRLPDYQLNDKFSLQSDTASFFLTVNPGGNNLRFVPTANNVTGNTLPAEPYFMYTAGNYYKTSLNPGRAELVGSSYTYSSSYDAGEGWTSTNIGTGATLSYTFSALQPYTGAGIPDPVLKINATGNAVNPRYFLVRLNGDSLYGQTMDYYDYVRSSKTLSVSQISSGSAAIQVVNKCANPSDRMSIAQMELTYARKFNFNNAQSFEFELPASSIGNYLEISGFNNAARAPVLYDMTNFKRYEGNFATAGLIKVVLEPSATSRKLMLVSQVSGWIRDVPELQPRNFIDYSLAANQGNYLMITNQALAGPGTNGIDAVEEYRAYRSSAAGGSYNAKVYLIDQLEDQFGLGIKQHPLSIRNFIRWARAKFSTPLKNVLLVGKGVTYNEQILNVSNASFEKLALVPTFGNPASDLLLTAEGSSSIPLTPIGRISVIAREELSTYLAKVKEYEQVQATSSPVIADKAWMKNVVHVVGAGDNNTNNLLYAALNGHKRVIEDTFYAANVHTFAKNSADAVQQVSSIRLSNLFTEGIGILTYFGHSSSSALEFNLDDPQSYTNPGKYPVFIVMGCNAGSFFGFNTARLSLKETISEKFVLAPDRGSIAFMASTHLGIIHYLDIYNSRNYRAISNTAYGATLGEIMEEAIREVFDLTTENDFYARFHCEQFTLHGDPALRLYNFDKPDYAIEEQLINITPKFIPVSEPDFKVTANFVNLGKSIGKKVVVELKRTYPDLSSQVIRRDTILFTKYTDSLTYVLPVVGSRDKGLNKITVTIDPENRIDELYETNNTVTKDVYIIEDDVRAIYPYDYSIVNQQGIKLQASTANPFAASREYKMEIDTSQLFNSSAKVTRSLTAAGGVLEFDPGISFTDSTVYYWRVSPVVTSGEPVWSYHSFQYIANGSYGFSQAHYYQHQESTKTRMHLKEERDWVFDSITNNLFVKNGVWGSAITTAGELVVNVNDSSYIRNSCIYGLIFNVFDGKTFKPWENQLSGGTGLYQSQAPCATTGTSHNFEFPNTQVGRNRALQFLRSIPDGHYVVLRNQVYQAVGSNQYAATWLADEAVYGAGNSMYTELKNQGFTNIDSINKPRAFSLVYRKNQSAGHPTRFIISNGIQDPITLSVNCITPGFVGYMSSPKIGPAKSWDQLHWNGNSIDPTLTDDPIIDIYGSDATGSETLLFPGLRLTDQHYDISSVDAQQYPYLILRMQNLDTINFTPYQLRYWMLTYNPVPEGAISPNLYFTTKDTVEVGEPFNFGIAFKNISRQDFDSVKVKFTITDKDNLEHTFQIDRQKKLLPGDTIKLNVPVDTRNLSGHNTIFVDFNPDNDQPEEHFFNNYAFRSLYVRPDSLNPLMDVTFDGVHILNRDIVAAKPAIMIELKDEAKWLLLNDTSLLTVQVRYPDGGLRRFYFDSDTLEFIPATSAGTGNLARVNFNPAFLQDGDYELLVTGKDRSLNLAGAIQYKIAFQVINKPMISNMLNYPNPFTTSTAFVFTITGSQVPQNIRIQVMTITGKIVREITKDELGPLHVGRNITEFKWDGTDQYGQKLANGIYLYRVITNLNGKALDKYKAEGDNTDKYFNKGYGKMYLMR